MNYIDFNTAIKIHDFIIKQTGGAVGLRNKDLLESPLVAIQDGNFYSSIESKLAFLMFSIVKNHPFIDGNKRSAVAYCLILVSININPFFVDDFAKFCETAVVKIAINKLSLSELECQIKEWFINKNKKGGYE